jgi:hypothetical protein
LNLDRKLDEKCIFRGTLRHFFAYIHTGSLKKMATPQNGDDIL